MTLVGIIKAFDAIIAFRDVTRRLKGGAPPPSADTALATAASPGLGGPIEARLTSVVVAALKEAFDRDHARLELERQQLEDQRRRAEEAMRLELRRQAAERELGRLRMLAAAALVGWLASVLVLGTRVAAASTASRVVLGGGWLLLLGAFAAAFVAQQKIGEATILPPAAFAAAASAPKAGGSHTTQPDAGLAASATLWLLVAGLAMTAISLLL